MTYLKCGAALALTLVLSLSSASTARACGGLFCSTVPNLTVNQTAERIVFVHHDDGTMTAIIEILYDGPTDEFAWVIPAPGVPTVDVSSTEVLDRLQAETNPQYQVQVTVEGSCDSGRGGCGMMSASAAGAPPSSSVDGGVYVGVTVEGDGIVGPYEWVSISVDPMTPDPADAAVDWLQSSGYEVNDLGRERLGPYLADGQNLLAFRLTKQSDVGAIRPVMLRYESPCPAIPLRPTAVAAADDMGILVWIFGPTRAVPLNYLGLELNEARINWIAPGSNYDAAVTDAANAAGGRGFVTELAGPTESVPVALASPVGAIDLQDIPLSFATDTREANVLLAQIANALPTSRAARSLVVALDDPQILDTFDFHASCPGCGIDYATPIDVDAVNALVFNVYESLVMPIATARQLFSASPYVTRLYTTMSADEMTSDPMFDFNPDLEDVSNIHVAEQTIHCDDDVSFFDAPWTMQLPQGTVVSGRGQTWPIAADADLPANYTVLQFAVSGQPITIQENGPLIDDELASLAPGDSGCSSGGWRKPIWLDLGAIGAVLFLLLARRSRRRWG